MKRIKAIIFSFNRAMQVDATLRSFYLHCKDAEKVEAHVLYRSSCEEYESQYETLKRSHPQVNFVRETDFRRDLELILKSFYRSNVQKTLLEMAKRVNSLDFQNLPSSWLFTKIKKNRYLLPTLPLPAPEPGNYILFMVDDNIFVRDFTLDMTIDALQSVKTALGFSLRLGLNTSFCYPLGVAQQIPEHRIIKENVLAHDWTSAQYDFNYPLEVSSSVYRASEIVPFVLGLSYANPNTLEGIMASHSKKFAAKFPELLWFNTSVAFCNPINKVQSVAIENRAAQTHFYTIEDLAGKFDRGERIDVKCYNDFVPNACHQEAPFLFFQLSEKESP